MERMSTTPAREHYVWSLARGGTSASRARLLRVAIGGIAHETNTFSPVPTTMECFRQRAVLSASAMIERCAGSRNVLGGMIAAASAEGVELLPTHFAAAAPGGAG